MQVALVKQIKAFCLDWVRIFGYYNVVPMIKIVVKKNGKTVREGIFDQSIISIGRDKVNDIQFGHYDKPPYVSKFHAAIVENEHGDYFIRDLGSTNGTKVNGEKVYRRILREGDLIEISGYTIEFEKKEEIVLPPDGLKKEQKRVICSEGTTDSTFYEHQKTGSYEEVDKALSTLCIIKDKTSFLSHLLEEICRISNATLGYYSKILNGGLSLPRCKKGIIGLNIPRPSYKLFKYVKEKRGIYWDTALRNGEPQEKTMALAMRFDIFNEPGFFYLEIAKYNFEKNSKEIVPKLSLLLKKSEEYLSKIPKKFHSVEPKKFMWKEKMVFNSKLPCMAEVLEKLERTSKNKLNVLLYGETGTGKEVAAKKIHSLSGRSGEFKAINCKRASPDTISVELFGTKKGIFTDVGDTPGLFELAHKGSLLIDEVECLTPEIQEKLLRPLRNKKVSRLGSKKEEEVDIKVIFATNEDLNEKFKQGLLRKDFYIGRVLEDEPIELPPLCERKDDIPLLVNFFIDEACDDKIQAIHSKAVKRLWKLKYDWPGNVQELKSVVLRALTTAKQGDRQIILEEDIAEALPGEGINVEEHKDNYKDRCIQFKGIERAECVAIIDALIKSKGNMRKTAEILGVSPPTLYAKCKKYGINSKDFKK